MIAFFMCSLWLNVIFNIQSRSCRFSLQIFWKAYVILSAVSGTKSKLLTIEMRNARQLFGNREETSMTSALLSLEAQANL